MQNNNFAAIDIGSNGARLLIKNVKEDTMGNVEFTKVLFLRIPLRLGKDVFTLGEISEDRERMMLCMIKSYKQLMKLYQVSTYRACATSAMPTLMWAGAAPRFHCSATDSWWAAARITSVQSDC